MVSTLWFESIGSVRLGAAPHNNELSDGSERPFGVARSSIELLMLSSTRPIRAAPV
jgi:hypothetical protein